MASQRDDNDRQDSDADAEENGAEERLPGDGTQNLALGEAERSGEPALGESAAVVVAGNPAEVVSADGHTVTALGTAKYVHIAFFAVAILAAFVGGKTLLGVWNTLAEWSVAADALPILQRYGEDERASVCTIAGALLGAALVLQTYRTESVRTWAADVADELARVTWPTREAVQTGTIVVVVATAVATIYVGLLDRFWAFVTNLVYGV